MKRDVPAIAADLEVLDESDFDEGSISARGLERLSELCDELRASHSAKDAAPLLLAFVERLENAYLGSPGPVVHTLEAMPGYEPYLRESLLHKPTSLTAWMANRIANARRPDRELWIQTLRTVVEHAGASEQVREEARRFVRLQNGA